MTESSAAAWRTTKNGRFFVIKIEDAYYTGRKSCENDTMPMTECTFRARRGKAGRRADGTGDVKPRTISIDSGRSTMQRKSQGGFSSPGDIQTFCWETITPLGNLRGNGRKAWREHRVQMLTKCANETRERGDRFFSCF